MVLHVVTSVGWLGAGAANVTLAVSALEPPEGLSAHASYLAIHLLDTWVVIPAAFGALSTGLVLSAFTSSGIARHWWVLAKLILTVVTIVFSTFGIGVWVETLIPAGADPQRPREAVFLVCGAIANLVGFVVMTWFSVVKPRGRTPWSRASPSRP